MELVVGNQGFLEFISQPWHWAVGGAAIALVLFLLNWMGHSFGVSSTFRTVCAMAGAGKKIPFFNMDVKADAWRTTFVIGILLGGLIAGNFLRSPEAVQISQSTVDYLSTLGIAYPASDAKGLGYVPTDLFNFGNVKGVLMAIVGGFLVGFGARYAGGCTSGHAITGLSHLQLPSLLTVIGFFIGGILMTWFIFPFLMRL
ncbi:MAG TPA: YeeE/YedE thiosulfate transporter family protein [Saprospiraceae bacterium]|nr:YeeE/YedE thiosulfate transporter family protein [Saprospiraceae bacterium]HMP24975.1 YeeE/YedE thiosulfate transporter family protein [Saprospiraceae bacterium]